MVEPKQGGSLGLGNDDGLAPLHALEEPRKIGLRLVITVAYTIPSSSCASSLIMSRDQGGSKLSAAITATLTTTKLMNIWSVRQC